MALSNIEPKGTIQSLDTAGYAIDPDLLDILKGFFQSKGFNAKTADILATNMIVDAIDSGDVTREDLLNIVQKGGDVFEIKTMKIQRGGTGYQIGDVIRFNYRGMSAEAIATVIAVGPGGSVAQVEITSNGIVEDKPKNPLSPSSTDGTGKDAFFVMIYQSTLKPNAELSRLASYLINVSRYPSSYTGVEESPVESKVYNRLVV